MIAINLVPVFSRSVFYFFVLGSPILIAARNNPDFWNVEELQNDTSVQQTGSLRLFPRSLFPFFSTGSGRDPFGENGALREQRSKGKMVAILVDRIEKNYCSPWARSDLAAPPDIRHGHRRTMGFDLVAGGKAKLGWSA